MFVCVCVCVFLCVLFAMSLVGGVGIWACLCFLHCFCWPVWEPDGGWGCCQAKTRVKPIHVHPRILHHREDLQVLCDSGMPPQYRRHTLGMYHKFGGPRVCVFLVRRCFLCACDYVCVRLTLWRRLISLSLSLCLFTAAVMRDLATENEKRWQSAFELYQNVPPL